jgi:hypothetical protein
VGERVRLRGGSNDAEIIDDARGQRVLEISLDDQTWDRYLRAEDDDPETGLREYISIGSRTGPAAACATCADPQALYVHGTRLADKVVHNDERHSILIRCRDCDPLFDFVPEGRTAPTAISERAARVVYSGAL